MSADDIRYFEERAEREIEAAQRATHVQAVQAHYQLASAYLDRIHGESSERETADSRSPEMGGR